MCERLGPVLGGVHGRIRRHEAFPPTLGHAIVVVPVQRLLIVGVRIAEQLVEPLQVLLRRGDQAVEVVVPDLVPEVPEQSPVRLLPLPAAPLTGALRAPRPYP